jgi:hypothetical protein
MGPRAVSHCSRFKCEPLTKNYLNQHRFCRYDALSIARGRGVRDIIILLGCPLIARPIAALAPQLLTRADDVIE